MPRPESATAPLRWLRALLLATVALLAGSIAHLTADGLLPGPVGMAVLLAVGTTTAAPLLRTRASTHRIVLLLVLGQTAVHALLTAASGHHEDEPGPVLSGPALWLHHLSEDLTADHAVMAVAHAAAATVVGLWLAHGEHALWLLVDLAARALAPRVRWLSPLVPTRPPRVVTLDTTRLSGRGVFTVCLRRRGPPVPCAS